MPIKDKFADKHNESPLGIMVWGAGGAMGQAAIDFLADNHCHATLYAGDYTVADAAHIFKKKGYSADRIKTFFVNAQMPQSLSDSLKKYTPNIVVSTLPAGAMAYNAAFVAAQAGIAYVSSNFLNAKAIAALDQKTKTLGIKGLKTFDDLLKKNNTVSQWGMGLDPGCDSFILRRALMPFTVGGTKVHSIKLVGAGISHIASDVYVKTWRKVTDGMGHRAAEVIIDGQPLKVAAKDKLSDNARARHETVTLYNGESIETFLNNDGVGALKGFAVEMGANISNLNFAANMTGRRIGHCDLWYNLIRDLDIMNNERIFDDISSMKDLLCALIKEKHMNDPYFARVANAPHLQQLADHVMAGRPKDKETLTGLNDWTKTLGESGFFDDDHLSTRMGTPRTAQEITEEHLGRIYRRREGHPDRSIIYVEVKGADKDGKPSTNTIELSSVGDPELSGMTSMQKTVSGTLARTAQLVLDGQIPNGLHSPEDHPEIGETILKSHIVAGLITVNNHGDAPSAALTYTPAPV